MATRIEEIAEEKNIPVEQVRAVYRTFIDPNGKKDWRTIGGISGETGLGKERVCYVLFENLDIKKSPIPIEGYYLYSLQEDKYNSLKNQIFN